MEVGVIISGLSLAKSVAEFFGLIESVTNQKLDSLIQAEFGAGLSLLEQATQSRNEQISLLREARNCFTKATVLEKNERLVLSYLGLAACHHHLGDRENAKRALKELLKTEVNFLDYKKIVLAAIPSIPLLTIPPLGLFALSKLLTEPREKFEKNQEKKKIQELKQCVSDYLKNAEEI